MSSPSTSSRSSKANLYTAAPPPQIGSFYQQRHGTRSNTPHLDGHVSLPSSLIGQVYSAPITRGTYNREENIVPGYNTSQNSLPQSRIRDFYVSRPSSVPPVLFSSTTQSREQQQDDMNTPQPQPYIHVPQHPQQDPRPQAHRGQYTQSHNHMSYVPKVPSDLRYEEKLFQSNSTSEYPRQTAPLASPIPERPNVISIADQQFVSESPKRQGQVAVIRHTPTRASAIQKTEARSTIYTTNDLVPKMQHPQQNHLLKTQNEQIITQEKQFQEQFHSALQEPTDVQRILPHEEEKLLRIRDKEALHATLEPRSKTTTKNEKVKMAPKSNVRMENATDKRAQNQENKSKNPSDTSKGRQKGRIVASRFMQPSRTTHVNKSKGKKAEVSALQRASSRKVSEKGVTKPVSKDVTKTVNGMSVNSKKTVSSAESKKLQKSTITQKDKPRPVRNEKKTNGSKDETKRDLLEQRHTGTTAEEWMILETRMLQWAFLNVMGEAALDKQEKKAIETLYGGFAAVERLKQKLAEEQAKLALVKHLQEVDFVINTLEDQLKSMIKIVNEFQLQYIKLGNSVEPTLHRLPVLGIRTEDDMNKLARALKKCESLLKSIETLEKINLPDFEPFAQNMKSLDVSLKDKLTTLTGASLLLSEAVTKGLKQRSLKAHLDQIIDPIELDNFLQPDSHFHADKLAR
eukprot:m.97600 g.97600  ORF g.97600 m.97600 type:complete len:686 (+) comp13604_c0_seq2:342-2399(+)